MSVVVDFLSDQWVQLVIIAVIGIIACYLAHRWIDKHWLGDSGKVAKCCVCGRDGGKHIPVITIALSNRLRIRPRSPRISYDYFDPRRLCDADHVERLGKLHREVSHFRTEVLDFSGAKYAAMVAKDRAALDELGKKTEAEPPKTSQQSVPDASSPWGQVG